VRIDANLEGGFDITDASVPITMFNGDGELITIRLHDGAMQIGVRDTSQKNPLGEGNYFNWYKVEGGHLHAEYLAAQEAAV